MDDNLMDLGTEFRINLRRLSNSEAEFTIEQLIAALEATTTLTELTVSFHQYDFGASDPTPEDIRSVTQPLCRCISNLRLHNAQHPLRRLRWLEPFRVAGEGMGIDENEMLHALGKFMVAAKQFGILCMEFFHVNVPVQFLVEFCRDNSGLKVLELYDVSFSGGDAALPLPLNNGPPNSSFILTLDKLRLGNVSFYNSAAATVFANLVAHVNVSSLILGNVTASNIDDEEEEEDDDDIQITWRILSELKMPSAEQLTLLQTCQHFKSALGAGTTSVTVLNAIILCDERINAYTTARLEILAGFIRRSVKLDSLTISRYNANGPKISPPPQLIQALEACATVMQIQVGSYSHQSDLSADEEQQMQKIMSRNRELDRFATNPGTYPTAELPELMRQFDNCPTGRYMLARRLPEVLPFAELYAMHLSRRRTNPPTPKKSKLE